MAAIDYNPTLSRGHGSPPTHTVALDAQFHNSNDLTQVVENFICTTAGTVKFVSRDSTTAVTITCLAGVVYWYSIKQIFATGTSATGLVGGY